MKGFNEQKKEKIEPTYSFVDDDCRVQECIDGFVSVEMDGYDTLFYCPVCNRGAREITGLRRYLGTVTYYSDFEMKRRREERKEIMMNRMRAKIPKLELSGVK